MDASPVAIDADISLPAALIGEPARASMLLALLNGRALPATELARVAGVRPATGSEHLRRLVEGGLLRVRPMGRHRYYELADERVAGAIEALQVVAPVRPASGLREVRRGRALGYARSCYDHLAGTLALDLAAALTADGVVTPLVAGQRGELLRPEHWLLSALGVRTVATGGRRPAVRGCLDWTERRPHLAGTVGAQILDGLLRIQWLRRAPDSRALLITEAGRDGLCGISGAAIREQ
jgi:DNA-binding transcriptional ArsR family regulator